jgi:hypothetical protein
VSLALRLDARLPRHVSLLPTLRDTNVATFALADAYRKPPADQGLPQFIRHYVRAASVLRNMSSSHDSRFIFRPSGIVGRRCSAESLTNSAGSLIISACGGDARAAVRELLADADFLRDQLYIASRLLSRGIGRGWAPKYERV